MYSCVPNKRGLGPNDEGGWKISKNQIAREVLISGGLEIILLENWNKLYFFVKWSKTCLMFIIYNQKNTRVKRSVKKYQTK